MKHISMREFVTEGYLQEANRRFFHPLGLALQVNFFEHNDAASEIAGVVDVRDDAEGMIFADAPDREKAERIDALMEARKPAREKGLGYIIQPVAE